MSIESDPNAGQAALSEIPSTPDDRQWAMFAHLGGIILGFIAPLIIWLMKKDQSPFISDQGKEALNFQLTMLIAQIIGIVTIFVVIGIVLYPLILIANIVFCIMAGMAANRGEVYRYPFNIRMVS